MARRKRASANDQPIGVGLTTKQMKRKKPLSSGYLVDIDPKSDTKTSYPFCKARTAVPTPLSPAPNMTIFFFT